ncbi:hypothetical protein AKJ45_03795 [candidate division MSBL1 archaeon SCGC-AAA261F19]|uniref:Resolvase/invertase-type recombinase catalytic domain-containing protein n=1 Tax=candidate division MSBL1 archaeon SCGC-AAA261F19 TaxID=1698275 RepID=A0A133V6C3_9EURY|nr:hypothetical protein AKJ45_03795 [candidate division MSBL1 archaeon SCGC-AAA261F19]
MPLMRVKEASEYTGLHPNTIRKYIDEGRLKGTRMGSQRQRVIEKSELDKFMGKSKEEPTGVAIYARVSTRKQKKAGNLDRQKARLVDYCGSNDYSISHIVTDVASGINENRRGLTKLIELSKNGEISRIVIEYKDRLARFGYEYLEDLFSINGVKIDCVDENGEKSYEEELVEDMLAIVSSFSARLYGRRGGKKVKKKTSRV